MFRKCLIACLTLLSLSLASVAEARNDNHGRWDNLGSKSVRLIGDRDSIHVNRGPYTKLRFSVHERAVEFQRVFVEFSNGDRIEVPVRDRIHAGGQTRAIDLPGHARHIKKIVFWYKTAPGSLERAKVSVWGRR
ncbi:hypothetical protein [Chitinilyticum piscinae]|uniref:DUF2541 family protein n=1 Tax=Chitinilyticum piscinae TaxID=2866724 RepID=A0A8J7FMX4_9NEIS|nr:hypothetical protein [Chitinilyticum piscinae]MBE9609541.1 hypothetical protein [Chitinilyticum piscinae]